MNECAPELKDPRGAGSHGNDGNQPQIRTRQEHEAAGPWKQTFNLRFWDGEHG